MKRDALLEPRQQVLPPPFSGIVIRIFACSGYPRIIILNTAAVKYHAIDRGAATNDTTAWNGDAALIEACQWLGSDVVEARAGGKVVDRAPGGWRWTSIDDGWGLIEVAILNNEDSVFWCEMEMEMEMGDWSECKGDLQSLCSLSLSARVRPAVPAPTTMKSYSDRSSSWRLTEA